MDTRALIAECDAEQQVYEFLRDRVRLNQKIIGDPHLPVRPDKAEALDELEHLRPAMHDSLGNLLRLDRLVFDASRQERKAA